MQKVQLEDDTERVKPHLNSTPTASSYSSVKLFLHGLLTLLTGGIQKQKEGGVSPTPRTPIGSEFKADHQPDVSSERESSHFSLAFLVYNNNELVNQPKLGIPQHVYMLKPNQSCHDLTSLPARQLSPGSTTVPWSSQVGP